MKNTRRLFFLGLFALVIGSVELSANAHAAATGDGFDRLKALTGDWVDADGAADGSSRPIVARYSVTAGGTAVMETLFPGTAHEMVTLYTHEGKALVLTHYCAAGNQPHMHAGEFNGHSLSFVLDGGANINTKVDTHMHSVKHEFVNGDELRSEWQSWEKGKPDGPAKIFHLKRLATS